MNTWAKTITVRSWKELVDQLHANHLVPYRPEEGGHLRSPYVFRGMDDAAWELETSFQRLPKTAATNPKTVEKSLLRSFRKYAKAGSFDKHSEWYILAVAQHNGLPTRCLDWTASPLVGAHFACGNENHKNRDGAIWCLHARLLQQINAATNPKAGGMHGIAWVYDTNQLERCYAGLDALDASAQDGEVLLMWEPPSLDQRIASQSGLLTLLNNGTASQDAFLQRQCQTHPDLVQKIVIHADCKSEVRDMLDQNNISERTLFPGLPGLCNWLKRYYGTRW